jgi:hypothetical protein
MNTRLCRLPLLSIVLALLTQCSTSTAPDATSQNTGKRTLLAIFAHPDDEATVSPVLAKYAAEGVTVYLAVATDG